MTRTSLIPAGLALALVLAAPLSAVADDKAPMPQTRGMQGMDPAAHEKWEKDGQPDPYKDCVPSAEKAAQMKDHPMPETKGMQGMDPKAHEVECPQPAVAKPDPDAPPKHVHKSTN